MFVSDLILAVAHEGVSQTTTPTKSQVHTVEPIIPTSLRLRCRVQVTLLSSGYMMYSGEREGLVPWFADGCGYPYDPAMHGLASDWVMDLVNVGFTKPEVRRGVVLPLLRFVGAMRDCNTCVRHVGMWSYGQAESVLVTKL